MIRAALAWRWTPALAVALVAAVLVWKLEAGRRSAAELARLAEAQRLEAAGIAVAAQKDAAGMRVALAAAVARAEDLAAEVERVSKAAPDARPVSVSHGTTGPVVAGGAPAVRPVEMPSVPGPLCLLRAGDQGEVRVDSATLQTEAGNALMVGAASAWRVSPGPETRLFGGALKIEGTVETVPLSPGWGFGATGWAGRSGWMVGPAASLPPARLWGLQGELSFGAGLGPSGEWGVGATALLRRWR